ncbi:MAG: tetratricopeptide repeat protein [Methanomicrobiales archaeon]
MPTTPDLIRQATGLAEQGMHNEALALLRTAIRQDPNNAGAWYNLGVTVYALGNYRDAVNAFGQAADIDPDFADAWFNKGIALVHLDKYPEALRAFDRGLKIEPWDLVARHQRDRVLENLSDTPKGTSPHEPQKQIKLL